MKWLWFCAAVSAWGQSSAPAPAGGMAAALARQRASVEAQRSAIRKQVQTMGMWLPIGVEAGPPVDATRVPCEPISEIALAPIVDRAAKAEKLDPKLLRSVIQQESSLRPCAVSVAGAEGLMQIMPDTAGDLGLGDAFDPEANVRAGARYLRQLLDRYGGDLFRALGAYNAGPRVVDEAGDVPNFPETKDYVTSIFSRLIQ